MKTIEESLNEEISKIVSGSEANLENISMVSDLAKAVFKNACLNYTKEAIKADRIDLLKNLKHFPDYSLNSKEDDLQRKQIQDSIINAPNIELL